MPLTTPFPNRATHVSPFSGRFRSVGVPIRNISDYSPFGVQLDGRTVSGDFYRRGFNGMEKDDEVKGGGNSYDFGARMYDSRVGRWWSRDPLRQNYPDFSDYNFAGNNPIYFVDPDGKVLRDKDGNILYTINPKESPFKEVVGGREYTYTPVYIYNDLGQKTSVYLVTAIDLKTNTNVKMSIYEEQMFNCHGFSSLDGQFLVNSSKSESNFLLMDKRGKAQGNGELENLVNYNLDEIKKGDIIVYFNKDGVAQHSAVFAGENRSDDKVDSKNGYTEFDQFKEQEVFDIYSSNPANGLDVVKRGFFTPRADKQLDIRQGKVNSERGIREVSEANVKDALEQAKPIKPFPSSKNSTGKTKSIQSVNPQREKATIKIRNGVVLSSSKI